MKLSQYAKQNSISYQTAWNHFNKGLFDGEIVVVNEVETDEEDIIQDLTSIITSFCARIYGKRRSKRKTEQLIKELEANE